jgi:hypothetical protein
MLTAQLDTGVLVGSIVTIVLAVIGLIATGLFAVARYWWGALACAAITFAVAGAAFFFTWFPFGYDYNHYVPKSGTVTAISTRLISDGNGGMNQRVAVWLNGHPYACDDTRCAPPALHKGMEITLVCEKEFQFNAPSPGYGCNWGKFGLNN